MDTVRLALAQSHVRPDVAANGAAMRDLMKRARAAGADIVQFTEGALSGYGKKALVRFERWTPGDWERLASETARILELAARLKLWVVFGSVAPLPDGKHPHNSRMVAGPDGRIWARYDKRYCSHTELRDWYTPGFGPCVFEVGGVRFGCVVCLDGRFPEIWEEYRRLGVHCVLFSTFSAGRRDETDARQDAIFGVTARAQAANHVYWVSVVTPANPVQGARTQLLDPLGELVIGCRRHRNEIAAGMIDLGADGMWAATRRVREWRAAARRGDIYRIKAGLPPVREGGVR